MISRRIIQAGESAECEMAYEHPNRNFTHLVAGCMGYLQSEVGIVFFLVAQKLNHRG